MPYIYPVWTLKQMPDGPEAATAMPQPKFSAILIAPGYLVAPTYGMDEVEIDFRLDPTVYIFDGKTWYTGKYVDRDRHIRIALIRADVPGTPIALTSSVAWMDLPLVSMIVGLTVTSSRTIGIWSRLKPIPCGRSVDTPKDDEGAIHMETVRRMFAHCYYGQVKTLSGAAMLAVDGTLAGLQTFPLGTRVHAGSSAMEIREFVSQYFVTWGRGVKNKPKI
jgi:hypothetical protein